ncbi:Putative transport protein YhhT [Halioglobus japonicus]|nr:Putative transport protein YhhT [Halioglobus japonicus]
MIDSEQQDATIEATSLVDRVGERFGVRVSLYCLATLAVLYSVYAARSLLMPIVVALLFSLLLSPLVTWLKRLRIPRPISSVLLLCLLGGPFVVLSIELAEPVQKWMGKLPELTARVTEELTEITDTLAPKEPQVEQVVPQRESGFSFSRFFQSDDDVDAVVEEPAPVAENALVEGVKTSGIEVLLSMLGAAPFIVAQFGVWLILVLFLLIYGPGLYNNFINLLPMIANKRRAVLLVGRLRQQLSRYILTVTVINTVLGLATTAALWMLGVEDAILWGVLVGLLNYAPYVGTMVSTCILFIAGFVQFGLGFSALFPALAFLGLNLLESQILTPTILGQHMRLNPLIMILWLLIWGSLWGAIGVLIAVPLLMCLKLVAEQLNILGYWVELFETQS